jgi:RND family efflux transporter MFP subunit
LRIVVACVVIGLVLAWQGNVFTDTVESGEAERPVRALGDKATALVESASAGRTRELLGSLRARSEVVLAPRVSGRVIEMRVEASDRIEEGQIVTRLESKGLRTAVGEAEAAVDSAEAELRGAQEAFARVKAGFEDNVASEVRLIEAQRRRDAAAGRLEQSREALAAAETRLGYATLRSPIDGVVIDTLADPGDLAMPGQPLMTLYAPERLEAQVSVPASLVSRFTRGATFPIVIEAIGFEGAATVRTLVQQAESGTRSSLARLRLTVPDDALPGMFVRLRIETGARDALVVPNAAIGRVRQLAFVWYVDDDDTLQRRVVRTGAQHADGRVEILSGLERGDRILAEWIDDPGARSNSRDAEDDAKGSGGA